MIRRSQTALSFLASAIAFAALLFVIAPAHAQSPGDDTYVPDWTNYQGYLTDGNGAPLNGNVDLYFALYSSSSGGTDHWREYHDDVPVENGYFYIKLGSTEMPMMYTHYDGDAQYMEVRVASPRCRPNCVANDAQYETLPRQQVGSVPYALKAHRAYSATHVENVHWDDITGKPVEFGGGYKYYIVVAKEGGDYTSVYDAVQSVTDATAEKPYLIYVAPGVYEETQTIVTKPYVHIKGAGKYATIIRNSATDKTLVLRSHVSVGYLSLYNYYPSGNSYAIYAHDGDYPYDANSKSWLYYIHAYAAYQGGSGQYDHYGVYAYGGNVNIHMNYVYATGEYAPHYNYGGYFTNSAQIYAKNSHFYGYYGQKAFGIYNTGSGTHLDAYYIKAQGKYASDYNYGLYNTSSAHAKLNKGYYYGYYGNSSGQYCYGIYNEGSGSTIEAYYVYGYGYQCSVYNYGFYNHSDADATVKYGYFRGYKGQKAYGFYNDGSGSELHAHYTYGYGEEASERSYGLYNGNGGGTWLYDGYYRGYKGQYCYGLFNNDSAGSMLEAHNANGYGKYCSKENFGLYNKYGKVYLYGGTYYGYAESTGGNDQYCFGIYSGGSQNSYTGWYAGYDVTAWAKNCYFNYGFYNYGGGYAEAHGGTYYALDGHTTYGAICLDSGSSYYGYESSAYGTGGSNANYGYTGANACHGKLYGGTYYGEEGNNTYGVYCANSNTHCYAERISSWGTKGSGNNYGYYNVDNAMSKVNHSVMKAACASGGCATKYAMYLNSGDVKAAYTHYDNGSAGGYKWTGGSMKCIGIYDYDYNAVNCAMNP